MDIGMVRLAMAAGTILFSIAATWVLMKYRLGALEKEYLTLEDKVDHVIVAQSELATKIKLFEKDIEILEHDRKATNETLLNVTRIMTELSMDLGYVKEHIKSVLERK